MKTPRSGINADENEMIGMKIVLKALEEPIKQMAINAGLEPAIILKNVKEQEENIGFDMVNQEYVNMKEIGIIDPTKVSKTALLNAASVASTILTTQSVVAYEKSEFDYQKNPAPNQFEEEF